MQSILCIIDVIEYIYSQNITFSENRKSSNRPQLTSKDKYKTFVPCIYMHKNIHNILALQVLEMCNYYKH